MITAATRLVALLGHPVAHSLSPRMQNAAFAARALDWAYVAGALDLRGARALVLGRGGAARAVAVALEDAGAASVRLASRRDADWPPPAADATILVNATPLRDEVPVPPHGSQQVVDLAYRPDGRPTALVAAARQAGCETF